MTRQNRPTRRPFGQRVRMHTAAVAGCIVFTACQDGVGPRADAFDAARAVDDHRALAAIIEADPLASFGALAGRAELGIAQGAGSRVPLISDGHRGRTFTYDAPLDRWIIDPDRTGAPANGVRFILYAVDPSTGRPDPERETGHADLIDHGATGDENVSLQLIGVVDGRTFLDYAFTAEPGDRRGAVTLAGFAQGDHDRLDFDIAVAGRDGDDERSLDVDFDLAIATREFSATGGAHGVERAAGDHGTIDLLLRHGDDHVTVDATGTDDTIDATFDVNGELFATARGAHDHPDIRGADGRVLNAVELIALGYIVHVTDSVFMLVECLVEPIGALIGLAIVL